MKISNRLRCAVVLSTLVTVVGCGHGAKPTTSQDPMSADANVTPPQFLSDLRKLPASQRQDYAAKHRGVVMRIMAGNDSETKQQLMSILKSE